MTARFNKRDILKRTLAATGGLRLLESLPTWNGLLVLNYHRIGMPHGSLFDHALWSATQDDFDQHVRMLASGFDVIGLNDLRSALDDLKAGKRRAWQTRRFAMITFDDGYIDNFEQAFPVLESHSVPGVFFITSGFLDTGRLAWWDEIAWMVRTSARSQLELSRRWIAAPLSLAADNHDAAIQRLLRRYYRIEGHETAAFLDEIAEATGSGRAPKSAADGLWMNWDMVRSMHAAGMSVGAHTVTHPILSRLSAEEQNLEICESRLRIEHELGDTVSALSYPVGSRDAFNDATRTALSRSSFDWAFSYYGGHLRAGADLDRFDIPRVAIQEEVTLEDFRSCCALPHVFARH
jgi:peptidoglycan/xylan/chitin deacetylase (PgdA/CDA1 family)